MPDDAAALSGDFEAGYSTAFDWFFQMVFVATAASIVSGAVGGALVVFAIPLLDRFKIDDVVGAISAHLVAGIWGTIAVPLTNPETSFGIQLLGIGAIGGFVIIVSTAVWYAIKLTIGIRASDEEEEIGLDRAELGLEAYPEFSSSSHPI